MNPDLTPFLRVLDPEDNQTGGGAASAVAGAMAAALTGMVARLSIGRRGLQPEGYYSELDRQAQELANRLLQGAGADSRAFDGVMAAYRLPKDTASELESRTQAIEAAMIEASRVPLQNAEACRQVLDLVAALDGRSNPNAVSDLACARFLALAGLRGCLSNIKVNLELIRDPKTASRIGKQLKTLETYLTSGGMQG